MRVLADENIPKVLVAALRESGHDVVWIHEVSPGVSDHEVLRIARDQERVLLTFDKDFGELAFRSSLPRSVGVVLFRMVADTPGHLCRRILDALATRNDWTGVFAVIDQARIRLHVLPDDRDSSCY